MSMMIMLWIILIKMTFLKGNIFFAVKPPIINKQHVSTVFLKISRIEKYIGFALHFL